MKWPELQVSRSAGRSIAQPGVQLEDLTPDEVLRVVLHEHPALVEYRGSLKTDETEAGEKIPVP